MKSATVIPLVLSGLLLLNCTPNSPDHAGNISQTGNGVVSGLIYQPDGKTSAKKARVFIRKKEFLADTSGILEYSSETTDTSLTDDLGKFVFYSMDTGTYVIEATDNGGNFALNDNVHLENRKNDLILPPDTLKPSGAIKGVVNLSEGGDPRKVLVLAFGIDRLAHVNEDGSFVLSALAEGKYDLRFVSSLDNYGVLDTAGIAVVAAETTDVALIGLPFTGIPSPKEPRVSYDTSLQIVTISWKRPDTELVKGFNVYRRNVDSNSIPTRINSSPIKDTLYKDSSRVQNQLYEYYATSIDKNMSESEKSTPVSVNTIGAFVITDSIVKGYQEQVEGNFGGRTRGVIDYSGNFYIVDGNNMWLQKLDSKGNFISKNDKFNLPFSLTIHTDSLLFICDYDLNEIIRTDLNCATDTIFQTIGKPSGICDRNDSIFVVTDSGVIIHDFYGKLLDTLKYSFSSQISPPDIVPSDKGNLYVVDDEGLFEINLQSRSVERIWEFNAPKMNQSATICRFNDDTLALVSSSEFEPVSYLYLIKTDGTLAAIFKLQYYIAGITTNHEGLLIGFSSDGKILCLKKR